jgi:hypothetical protein
VTSKNLYGIAIVLVALLVLSATAAAYFYVEYQQASQSNNTYVNELTTETSRYSSLASGYNSSLSLENATLSLLVGTIAVINTSLPAYQQASASLSQLWTKYLSLRPAASPVYSADVLFMFGNGTRVWHNDTQLQPGWNAYTETVVLTHGDLQAQWYPQYQEHLVTGLYGIPGSETMSWFLWTYNRTASWQPASVGADEVRVYNGSILAWTFCGESPSFAPQCTP